MSPATVAHATSDRSTALGRSGMAKPSGPSGGPVGHFAALLLQADEIALAGTEEARLDSSREPDSDGPSQKDEPSGTDTAQTAIQAFMDWRGLPPTAPAATVSRTTEAPNTRASQKRTATPLSGAEWMPLAMTPPVGEGGDSAGAPAMGPASAAKAPMGGERKSTVEMATADKAAAGAKTPSDWRKHPPSQPAVATGSPAIEPSKTASTPAREAITLPSGLATGLPVGNGYAPTQSPAHPNETRDAAPEAGRNATPPVAKTPDLTPTATSAMVQSPATERSPATPPPTVTSRSPETGSSPIASMATPERLERSDTPQVDGTVTPQRATATHTGFEWSRQPAPAAAMVDRNTKATIGAGAFDAARGVVLANSESGFLTPSGVLTSTPGQARGLTAHGRSTWELAARREGPEAVQPLPSAPPSAREAEPVTPTPDTPAALGLWLPTADTQTAVNGSPPPDTPSATPSAPPFQDQMDEVNSQITYWATQNVQKANFTVSNEEGAPLEVSLSFSDGELNVAFETDEAGVREMLANGAQESLQHLLEAQGISLGSVSVGQGRNHSSSQQDDRDTTPTVELTRRNQRQSMTGTDINRPQGLRSPQIMTATKLDFYA